MKSRTQKLFVFIALLLGAAGFGAAGSIAQAAQYTAIGDSLTFGQNASPVDPNAFTYRIRDFLKTYQGSWTFTNRGVVGATAPQVQSGQLAAAIADNPNLVTLTVGADDVLAIAQNQETAAQFDTAFNQILSGLRGAVSNPLIVVANVPDLSKLPAFAGFTPAQKAALQALVVQINGFISTRATQYSVPVVDLFNDSRSYDTNNISSDGFHPNNNGHAVLAQAFLAIIAPTYTVINTNDSGAGSLRQAILDANAHVNSSVARDLIAFNIPAPGPFTITPTSGPLPTITDPVIIDGYTQPDSTPNTQATGDNANLQITLNGFNGDSRIAVGLNITAGSSLVRGLAIDGFSTDGIQLNGPGNNNSITGNFIGVNRSGSSSVAIGNGGNGVLIANSSNNTVGGTAPADRNILSGNGNQGVQISVTTNGGAATANIVLGNYIGVSTTGSNTASNFNGIIISGGAQNNVIGGTATGAGNVISGNSGNGINIQDTGSNGNTVAGNFVGTGATGLTAVGNSDGITVGTNNNIIGGPTTAARNVISGNNGNGLVIYANGASNTVQNNFIGTDVNGAKAVGNAGDGIFISNSPNNTVGGAPNGGVGVGNLISGNGNFFNLAHGVGTNGIEIFDSSQNGTGSGNNKIQGNFIGTDVTGTIALGNLNDGIYLPGADNTLIGAPDNAIVGGADSGLGNLISGNAGNGIETNIADLPPAALIAKRPGHNKTTTTQPTGAKATPPKPGTTKTKTGRTRVTTRAVLHNVIQGNFIGTDVTGTVALPNVTFGGAAGIYLRTPNNIVGGTAAGAGNLISGNGTYNPQAQSGNLAEGIRIESSDALSATNNVIQGNFIGTKVDGQSALPNTDNGIFLNAAGNTVGSADSHNTISGNGQAGIKIADSYGNGNTILGNFIGTDYTGVSALGNGTQGILINGATNTVGGTTAGARNIVANNGGQGIYIEKTSNTAGDGNIIQGNFIGLNANSTALGNGTLANVADGIVITTNNNTVGGTAAGAGNTIAFNTHNGVTVVTSSLFNNSTPVGNMILGNSIFSNTSLGIDLGNDGVTPNDAGAPPDADAGPNNLQNFPALTTATTVSGNTTITGSLDSTPSTNFRIEFFLNAAADSSGFGEGQNLLGAKNVLTDATGHLDFSATFNGVALSQGQVVTSTATRLDTNGVPIETSEFSQAVAATFADLSITNTDNPDPVDAGGTLTYTLTVTNNGPDAANNLTVVDTLPTGVTFVSATGTGWTSSFDSGTNKVTLTRPSLGKVAAPTITITVTAPSEGGSLTNTATVSSSPGDPDTSNNTATQTTTVTPISDLSIAKTGTPDPVNAGGTITYTLQVSNAGISTASAVSVVDTLPAGVTFVSAVGTGWTATFDSTTNQVTLTRPTLIVGGAPTITITVKAPAAGGNSITNSATVSSGSTDRNLANNTSTATTRVNPVVDLTLVKTGAPNPVATNSNLTYTLTVVNRGPNTATGITLTDTLPAGVTFVSSTPQATNNNGTLTVALGSLVNGANATVTIVVKPTTAGTITNTASVTSTELDSDTTNNSASVTTTVQNPPIVTPTADIAVTQTAAPTAVTVGGNVTFTVNVINNGPDTATNVVLSDVLPSGVTLVSAAPAAANNQGGTLTFNLGTLAKGASSQVTIVVRTNNVGTITNTATAAASETDSNTANNKATASATASVLADVRVSLSGSANPVLVGNNLTYTLTVVNAGPSPANNVVLTNKLPTGLAFVSSSPGAVFNQSGTQGFTLGTLASGATITVTIVAQAAPGAAALVTDTASVTATEPDPNTANNSATVTTTITPVADLNITLDGPGAATLGANLSYTMKVSNAGPSNATGVVVTYTVPAGETFVSATPAATSQQGKTLTFNIGALAAGATQTFTIAIRGSNLGLATTTAKVTGNENDPNIGDNTANLDTNLVSGPPPTADLALTLKATPNPVVVGRKLSYQLTLTNNGPDDAPNVVATDTFPLGVTPVLSSVFIHTLTGGPINFLPNVTLSGRTITAKLGTLKRNEGLIIGVDVTVLPTAISPLVDTATVNSSVNDPNKANNSATTRTTITPLADLSVTSTQVATTILGQSLTYRLVVKNNGPSTATNVVLTETLVSRLLFVSGSPVPASRDNLHRIYRFNLGTLASGAQASVTLIVRGIATGSAQARASVAGTETDPIPTNNAVGQTVRVVPQADLGVTMTGQPTEVLAGTSVTFTIKVRNNGPNPATNARLNFKFPSTVAFVASSPQRSPGPNQQGFRTIVFALGTIPVGGQVTVTVRLRPLSATIGGLPKFISGAIVSSSVQDPDLSNNVAVVTTSLRPAADLSVTNSSSADTVATGSTVDYNLVVTNNGPSPATGVKLTDAWAAAASFVSATTSQGNFTQTSGEAAFNIGNLAVGAKATIKVTLRLNSTGNTTNTATVMGTLSDPNLTNNTAHKTTIVTVAAPNFTIISTPPVPTAGNGGANGGPGAGGGAYLPGLFDVQRHFVQTITIKNTGTAAVKGPVSLVLIDITNNAVLTNKTGDTGGHPYVNLNIGTDNLLSPGESATITLEFDANSTDINYTSKVLTGSDPR